MDIVKFSDIEDKIITINDLPVIIDSDVASLYDVTTKEINQAVKNNAEKFPDGYVFLLTQEEKLEVVKNFDHLKKLKFSTQLPKAFTEKGLYMLATILKSPQATQTTIAIIETFTKIRKLSSHIKELSEEDSPKKKHALLKKSGDIISEILDDSLSMNESETTIELNFAVLKLKHTIKRK